jgi:hypothetical protein
MQCVRKAQRQRDIFPASALGTVTIIKKTSCMWLRACAAKRHIANGSCPTHPQRSLWVKDDFWTLDILLGRARQKISLEREVGLTLMLGALNSPLKSHLKVETRGWGITSGLTPHFYHLDSPHHLLCFSKWPNNALMFGSVSC